MELLFNALKLLSSSLRLYPTLAKLYTLVQAFQAFVEYISMIGDIYRMEKG